MNLVNNVKGGSLSERHRPLKYTQHAFSLLPLLEGLQTFRFRLFSCDRVIRRILCKNITLLRDKSGIFRKMLFYGVPLRRVCMRGQRERFVWRRQNSRKVCKKTTIRWKNTHRFKFVQTTKLPGNYYPLWCRVQETYNAISLK